jgi:hypothetical protein
MTPRHLREAVRTVVGIADSFWAPRQLNGEGCTELSLGGENSSDCSGARAFRQQRYENVTRAVVRPVR